MKRLIFSFAIILMVTFLITAARPQDDSPPPQPVKIIFIHHSTGEGWIMDDYGGLGLALAENNYYLSDTNYGWGPNGIGDRTDIPNWIEWFASAETPTYMNALYNESGQHSEYTRAFADPGGENQIILFKSCFPNSALEGSPNDPPDPDGWLTVGHAKYVYNTILQYFATRPDKLFIVITAPPLSDPTYADNARTFNNWLKNDWMVDYEGSNVAVFDFYDVLTGPGGGNTLYYPTGDDHPSAEGSRIATAEFIPVLNAAYNRWQAGDTSTPLVDEAPAPAAEASPAPELYPAQAPSIVKLIDDFEGGIPIGSHGWEVYKDENPETSISCAFSGDVVHSGANAMQIDYKIALYTWATCHLEFDNPQNWSSSAGVSFYAYAAEEGTFFNVDLFSENAESRESYVHHVRLSTSGAWEQIYIPWEAFTRVDWEENPGSSFAKPDQISGLAFGFDTPDGSEQAPVGVLYIDDLALGESTLQSDIAPPDIGAEEMPANEPVSAPLPCVGGLVLPLGLAGLAFKRRKK
jgi:hypothetical protein